MIQPCVIFVGMNNKPGFEPLDSASKSGKLIDKLIFEIGHLCRTRKTNLFDLDHFPSQPQDKTLVEWMLRAEYNPGDVIVPLGTCVHKYFRGSRLKPIVYLGHPSAVWSNENKVEYVLKGMTAIKLILTQP